MLLPSIICSLPFPSVMPSLKLNDITLTLPFVMEMYQDQDCSLKNRELDVPALLVPGSLILEVGARPPWLDCASSTLESVPCPLPFTHADTCLMTGNESKEETYLIVQCRYKYAEMSRYIRCLIEKTIPQQFDTRFPHLAEYSCILVLIREWQVTKPLRRYRGKGVSLVLGLVSLRLATTDAKFSPLYMPHTPAMEEADAKEEVLAPFRDAVQGFMDKALIIKHPG
ncbi:hypothetical protein STEG23_010871 [Scotinomys teguina]